MILRVSSLIEKMQLVFGEISTSTTNKQNFLCGVGDFCTADGGIDIVVIHNGITYAIQCKDHENILLFFIKELTLY